MLTTIARVCLLLVVLIYFMAGTALAGSHGLFFKRVDLPDGRIVVVAEPDREPRSVGSYSVRLYSGRNPRFPFDEFVAGVIESRDGVIVGVELAYVDADNRPDLVVTMRSVGTGSFLAADAFALRADRIERIAHVDGLAPQADILTPLRGAI